MILQFAEILGKGNGGMVRKAIMKPSGIPVAIKVSIFGGINI